MRNAAKIGGTVTKKKKYNDGGMTGDPVKKTTGKKGAVYPSAPSTSSMPAKKSTTLGSMRPDPKMTGAISGNNRMTPPTGSTAMIPKPGVQSTPVASVRNPMKKATRIDNRIERLTNRRDRMRDDDGMNKRQFEKAGRIRRKKYELTNKRNALTNYTEVNMAKGGTVKKKMAKGGVITSPIQTRQGNRPDAGSFMAKGGQKFPDLNRDGKRTFADVLKGRGVYSKKKKKYGMGGGPGDGDPVVVPPAAAPVPTPAPAPASPGFYDLAMQTAQASPRGARVALRNARKMEEAKATGTRKGANFGTGAAGIGTALTGAGNLINAVKPGPTVVAPAGGMKRGGAVKHPGFKAVQAKIAAKSGVSKKAAGAILASSTRKASAKAKAANPRLKRVKR